MKLFKCQCAVWQTFLTCFWLNAGDWKLVPGTFMILLQWQYSEIWSFLIVDICHLIFPYLTFQKSEALRS